MNPWNYWEAIAVCRRIESAQKQPPLIPHEPAKAPVQQEMA